MRVTNSMYYDSLYGKNHSKLSGKLFDVTKQIASGLKIQYAKDDVRVFTDTMRLDNELSALAQVKDSTESGYKLSNQTDTVLNEFNTSIERIKVLLIQAASDANSDSSRDAISSELNGLNDHLKNLANTSINGQFLFSGSAVNVKPISNDGTYNGNDISLNSILGSGLVQAHNITGQELFLGEELSVKRKVTTNIPQYSLVEKYPDFSDPTVNGRDIAITPDSSIRDLMGDTDDDTTNSSLSHFYINGVKHDGSSFKKHVELEAYDSVDDLLVQIGNAYGNTTAVDLVNVSINMYGEIVIEDKMPGSSKLEFHMVGAIDFENTDGNDAANINDAIYNATTGLIDNLNSGETDFNAIIHESSTAENPDLYVKNFVKSSSNEFRAAQYTMDRSPAAGDTLSVEIQKKDGSYVTYSGVTYAALETAIEDDGDFNMIINGDDITFNATAQGLSNGVSIKTDLSNDNGSGTGAVSVVARIVNSHDGTGLDSLVYDRVGFSKDGSKLSSTTPQIIKETNAFASAGTKISEVADLSKGTAGSLDGTKFILSGNTIMSQKDNAAPYYVEIDFATTGSTFSVDTTGDGVVDTPYRIFNMGNPRVAVDADEMTYQQLMNVVNMVVTNSLPIVDAPADYDNALRTASFSGSTTLSYDGKIEFNDTYSSKSTHASISLYDANAGDFNTESSVMTFNSNNSLTIRDPKTDFFKDIDAMIESVNNYNLYPNATTGDARSIGVENSLEMMGDIQKHMARSHALVGAQSNSFSRALERTQMLEISTMRLRSSILDTDLAEASLKMTQLTINYESMLSTVGKISKLSLVNYL